MAEQMAKVRHEARFLAGPAGQLESLLWTPATADQPALAALVCHPHPLYGGTMHNKVVYQTAKTLHEYGLPVLRFNFRGVGQSEGVYDHGAGETGDVAAALDFLAAQFPETKLLVAGFSFGSWVGMRVGCKDSRVTELIGLGLPVNDTALDFAYLQKCAKPKLLLIGERDQYAASEKAQALAASIPGFETGETRLEFVPGADHFFTGHLDAMNKVIANWVAMRHPELSRLVL